MHGNDGTYNFAMTGKTFAVLKKSFPDVLRKILINGTIFVSGLFFSTIFDDQYVFDLKICMNVYRHA